MAKKPVDAGGHTVCGSDLKNPQALPAQKEVDERSAHKVPLSLFRAPSPRVGLAYELGPLDRKDFFAAAHQNLVKTALVYPHFSEEKKK